MVRSRDHGHHHLSFRKHCFSYGDVFSREVLGRNLARPVIAKQFFDGAFDEGALSKPSAPHLV
jgi:hypothetical protein